jgi:hypothetical protein
MADVPNVPGGRRIIIAGRNMGLPDVSLKPDNRGNFNTIDPSSRNNHARAASMLDNY